MVTLTFDLELLTHLSQGPNTSSYEYGAMCKSVQWFTRYSYIKKLQTDAAENGTFCSLLPFTVCGRPNQCIHCMKLKRESYSTVSNDGIPIDLE